MNKRGLSTIVITLIIIVLSLVAIGIVWGVVSNILKSQSKQATSNFGQMFISLSLENVALQSNGDINVTVLRNSGEGDLEAINFIISDGVESKAIRKDSQLSELGAHMFTLTYAEVGSIGIKTISVAPITSDAMGNVVDTFELETLNTQTNAGASCKSLLSFSHGRSGIYWINPGGILIKAYCDMSTDDGGWTLAAVCVPPYPYVYENSTPTISECWNTNALGEVINPESPSTVKLSDSMIQTILNSGDKITRAYWSQHSRHNPNPSGEYNPVTGYLVYNLFVNPLLWTSVSCGVSGNTGRNFYVKYSYANSWGTAITPNSTTCSCSVNGWSNTLAYSCGTATWIASCEKSPSMSHNCQGNTGSAGDLAEQAEVVLYIR